MNDQAPSMSTGKRVARKLMAPLINRVDMVRHELTLTERREAALAAQIEQLTKANERLDAFQELASEEISTQLRGEILQLLREMAGADPDQDPALAIRDRFDHSLLHAEAVAEDSRTQFKREIGDLRTIIRLTQALAERAVAAAANRRADDDVEPIERIARRGEDPSPARHYSHAVPSFDTLYRAFEDRHRGTPETIRDRQRDDYLELLSGLDNPELPIADLGCGRGELVQLLVTEGQKAIGVDSNLGQVVEGDPELFVESDLFDWLDTQADSSCRAVVAMHVVEHLPTELQVRLVFESRRVLAENGVLILETPNTLSVSTAATNFWVDPTHERPVHPLFIEFLAEEAGFVSAESRPLHQLPVEFPSNEHTEELVHDLNSLILGSGDIAIIARR